jgi:hypothetical protein
MSRPRPLHLVLTLSVLSLAACGENATPTQPEAAGDPAAAAPQFALASNTWTPKAPLGFLLWFSAGVLPNSAGQSILYTFGGTTDEGGTGFPTRAYNVSTNTWTWTLPSNGVFGFDGNYSAGVPHEFTAATWAYDPAANRLIRKADMPKASGAGVTGVIGGQLFVLPGSCSTFFWPALPGYCESEPIRRLFRYDPPTNTWISRRWSPHFHKNGAAGVINGKFYVAGGLDDHDLPTAAFEVYDPATNTWRTLAPVPTAGRAIGAALGSKLFVIVGRGSERHAYEYDRGTNAWRTRATPTWDHFTLNQVTLDGRSHLLAVGGVHVIPTWPYQAPNDSELYTP